MGPSPPPSMPPAPMFPAQWSAPPTPTLIRTSPSFPLLDLGPPPMVPWLVEVQVINECHTKLQELKARVAPVLARWRDKLLALALEAFQSNAAASCSKRLHVHKALQYWNNRALAGAFAQWLDSVQV